MSKNERSKLTSKAQDVQKEVLFSTEKERIAMSLNVESKVASGLLIQRLTELYENPIEATVRETISNALDAVSIADGVDEPTVEISTPTPMNPVFEVKDNGIGMSYEDIKNIYAKYGSSTKSEDLEQIGAYGLGAKSPLAYGNEFTVTSVKDGEKTVIIVAREDLTNYIKVIDNSETDEPNGTIVSVPVKASDISEFKVEVNKYKNKPIDIKMMIDGKKVDSSDYALITDKLVIYEDDSETVKARMWVNVNNVKNAIETIVAKTYNGYELGALGRSYKLLLGGWAYENSTAKYMHGVARDVFLVELKPGVVGFNSSRDAIIPNEKLDSLNERIESYIISDNFIDDLASALEKHDKKAFMEFIAHTVDTPSNIHLERNHEDSELRFGGSEYVNITTFEKGQFSFTAALNKLDKYKGEIYSLYKELKVVGNNSSNWIFKNNEYRWMSPSSISQVNKLGEERLANDGYEILGGHHYVKDYSKNALFCLVNEINTFEEHDYVGKFVNRLAIITDVNEKNFPSVRRNRKGLNRLLYKDSDSKRKIIVALTSMSEKEAKDVLSSLMLEINADEIKYYTPETLNEAVKANRVKKSKVKESKQKRASFSSSVIEYNVIGKSNATKNKYRNGEFDSYKSTTKHTFTVLGTFNYANDVEFLGHIIWYANTHNIDSLKDITLLYAYDNKNGFKHSDLVWLTKHGKVYHTDRPPRKLSSVKLYEEIKGNIAGRHWVLDSSPTRSEEMFFIAMSMMSGMHVKRLSKRLDIIRKDYNAIAEQLGEDIYLPHEDFQYVDRFMYYPKFDNYFNYSNDTFVTKENQYQLKYLNDEQREAVTYASLLLSSEYDMRIIDENYEVKKYEVSSSRGPAVGNVSNIPSEGPKLALVRLKVAAIAEMEMLSELIDVIQKSYKAIERSAK